MKLIRVLFAVLFVFVTFSSCNNTGCKDEGWSVCREGTTYWVDQCGNEVGRLADCECGCNDELSDCKRPCDCIPSCNKKCCGDNDCGGTCSFDCSSLGMVCNEETCRCNQECVSNCENRECGDDGCGGVCGTCAGMTEYCTENGRCVDDCIGLQCGLSPNAGIDCGSCDGSDTCIAWQCRGQIWQNPPADHSMSWQEAVDYCDDLYWNGQNDWRLPTISELRSLIDGCGATEPDGECHVTDNCLVFADCHDISCGGCSADEGPSSGCYWKAGMSGQCSWYWSSSVREDLELAVWVVYFYLGSVNVAMKDRKCEVRCIR